MSKSINDRLKILRKSCNKSQEELGKVMGITKSGISDIENGRRKVTEQHIIMLKNWDEFNVNEEWLRNGTGEMFIEENKDDRFSHNIGKLTRTDDETIINWVNTIAETSPEALKEVEEFMKKLLHMDK